MKAVILAAGAGSRLRRSEALPKPCVSLGGVPLLERVVRNAARAGITEFVIVVGHRGERAQAILAPRLRDCRVQWVQHQDWDLGNGTSVLAARPFVGDEPCLVLMADHLIFPATLASLIQTASTSSECVMAIDRKRGGLVDSDDAMKVRVQGRRVTDVGKSLESYDAIDIGASVCRPVFFEELEAAAQAQGGKCSHSDGMRRLAASGRLLGHDIGADRWEDVDTEEAWQAATRILLDSLRKPTDGFMSRVIERHLSLSVTRVLVETSVTPNQVSMAVLVIGAVAAALFAQPSDGFRVAGAIVFWCASFLDGCDGELARLKFLESRLGGWLDLWIDNLVHSMVFFGMGVGLFRETGDIQWLWLGGAAVVGVVLSVGLASWNTLRTSRNEGPLFVSVFGSDRPRAGDRVSSALRRLVDALSRRDFILGVVFVALFGWIHYFLWAAAIGANLYFLALLLVEVSEHRAALR